LYDSFGNTLGMWGSLAAGNTYRYSSKEVDARSGGYYYGYRWYAPNLQRWMNRDPIGEAGGINLYQFADNNSVNEIDPSGNQIYPYGPNAPSTWPPYSVGMPPRPVPPAPSDPSIPSIGPADPNATPYSESQQTIANDGLLIGSDLYGTQMGNDIADLNASLYSPMLPLPPVGKGMSKCSGFKVTPPNGKFGSGNFGNAMHQIIAQNYQARFPDVRFDFNVNPGQRGVDIIVPDEDVDAVGFKYGEIKPDTTSGQNTLNGQIQNWQNNGTIPPGSTVQPITYDPYGNVGLGFK